MTHNERDKSDLKGSNSETAWEPGVRRATRDGRVLAVSALPVCTGERAVDVNAWLRRKTVAWLDLDASNSLFGAELSLMFLSLSLLSIAILGFGIMVSIGINQGRWDWTPVIFMLVGNLLVSLPWGLCAHLLVNQSSKVDSPVRFHRQRREVAMPRWVGNAEFKVSLWNIDAGLITYIILLGTIGFTLVPYTIEYSSDEYRNRLVLEALVVLVIEIVVISAYVFFALRLKKKHGPRLVYEIHPWEKLVAFIQTQENQGPSLMLTSTVLTLAVPKPDDPESALAAASINVGHETSGLAQWECIRRFMEEGPDACPAPRNDDTLANYKINCRKAYKEMSFLPWAGKKIGDWFFQRYLAHIITERRTQVVALRRMPAELKAWSEPLPESRWAQPSEELQALNRQLTRAYERGLNFSQMGPLSKWIEEEKARQPLKKRGKGRHRARVP